MSLMKARSSITISVHLILVARLFLCIMLLIFAYVYLPEKTLSHIATISCVSVVVLDLIIVLRGERAYARTIRY